MPKTDPDPLGPNFAWRLRAELDRVQPRFSSARYLSPGAGGRVGSWRFAPAALAIGLAGIVGLTAYAATGSTNPAVWTERAKSVIQAAPPSPTPESTPGPARPQVAPPAAPARQSPAEPSERPEPTEQPEPSGSPEPRESPEPSQSPEPFDEHSGSGSSGESANPLPTPSDH